MGECEWIIFPHEMMFCLILDVKHLLVMICLRFKYRCLKQMRMKMDIKQILRGKDTMHKSRFGKPLSGKSI